MNEPTESRNVLVLIALVNAMIEYWKEIARRNFVKAHPQADPSEFEQHWPKALANFLLAETLRVAKSLRNHLKTVSINNRLWLRK